MVERVYYVNTPTPTPDCPRREQVSNRSTSQAEYMTSQDMVCVLLEAEKTTPLVPTGRVKGFTPSLRASVCVCVCLGPRERPLPVGGAY